MCASFIAVRTYAQWPGEDRLWQKFQARFSCGQRIGRGGEGSVYLCTEMSTTEPMVVKKMGRCQMLHGKIKEDEILGGILELRPYIVQFCCSLFDPWTGAGMIVLEYCDGNSLANLINNYRQRDNYVPEAFIWHVFQQMADACNYIHRNGIYHRDLKPDNVLLNWNDATWGIRRRCDDYPFVKLADFGMAGVKSDPHYSAFDFAGTLCYQPPEIPLATEKCDIWGIGATVHELTHLDIPLPRGHLQWDFRAKGKCNPKGKTRDRYIQRSKAYSFTLYTFTCQMLAWCPGDRPSASQLSRLLRAQRPHRQGDDFQPLRSWATTHRNVAALRSMSQPKRKGRGIN